MGDSVREEFENVFLTRKVPEYLNKTHIVLIPKIQGPNSIRNYKPISLCNSVYKIIVTRLRPHLDSLISPYQATFVPGKRRADNAIIVQELVHTIGRMKGSRDTMAIKVNLEKAYDRIEWNFIREMLIKFNVPQKLTKLIISCVTSFRQLSFLMGAALNLFPP